VTVTGVNTAVPADGNTVTAVAGATFGGCSGKIVELTLEQPQVAKTRAVAAAPRSEIERRMGVPLDEAVR